MKAMGYEPTMDGMDDQDVKDALEAMDRRNVRRQDEWQYPRYKPVDPAFAARIYRQMGRPYDASLIPEEEKHYIGGWDNGDDDDDDAPQAKPAQNLFAPSRGGGRGTDGQWKLNWGNGNMFGQPKTMEHRPDRDDGRFSYQRMPGKPFGNGQADTGTGLQLFNYGGPASHRQDALRLAYSPPSAATSKKYIQDWYDANVWTDPDVLAAATPAEREAAIHRIIATRGGEGLLKHYNTLHINENDAEAARMNDVKYIVDSLRRVQDGPGDSGTGQDATGRMSYVPSGHDAGVHMKGGVNNPYAGGYANGGAEGNMLLPEAKAYADSEFGEKVLAIGRRQLGLKYELGGDGIKTTDCGKFTLDTYNQVGVDLEDRTAPGQYDFCKRNGFVFNDLSQLRPGDLIFFKDTYDSGDGPGSITHVGIYAGNGIMLHAGSSKGVSYADLNSDYWQSHLYGYGRPRR